MLTVEQCLKLTPTDIIKRSLSYQYIETKLDSTQSRRTTHEGVVVSTKKGHKVRVFIQDDEIKLSSKCEVGCDCEYFKYHLEIPLAARKSARVTTAAPRLTKETNPDFKPGLCVHLVAVLRTLLRKDSR